MKRTLRVQDARATRGLAKIDVADLRKRLATQAIQQPRHAFEDAALRDPKQAAELAKDALRAEQAERETRARQAEEAAIEARAGLRFLDRAFAFLGVTTMAQAQVDALQDRAGSLAVAAEVRRPTRSDFDDAAERGKTIAKYREKVFAEWEREQGIRPEADIFLSPDLSVSGFPTPKRR